jgi:hypothetical protein
MSAAVAPQPLTVTGGACAPGVPPQPTALLNISFAAVNSPPAAQTTISNPSAVSTFSTTSAVTFTQTAVIDAAQLLYIVQSVGPACSSLSTYAWPAALQQTIIEVPIPTTTASSAASPTTVDIRPATATNSNSNSINNTPSPTAAPEEENYDAGRLGPYQSAGVGVSCTVVFLAVIYLLFLLWRRRPWLRRRGRGESGPPDGLAGEKVELPANSGAAELPAIELNKEPIELPAFETWTSATVSELSSREDDLSERGKTGSPMGDWLPSP